jgi:hypothetical protein
MTTEHIPRYRDSLLRIELGHPVLVRGNRRGTVDGFHLTDENAIRVKVDTEEGGWLICTIGEIEYHEVPDVDDLVRMPANIAARFDANQETDADVVALVNAYRLSRSIVEAEILDDPLHAVNGARQ